MSAVSPNPVRVVKTSVLSVSWSVMMGFVPLPSQDTTVASGGFARLTAVASGKNGGNWGGNSTKFGKLRKTRMDKKTGNVNLRRPQVGEKGSFWPNSSLLASIFVGPGLCFLRLGGNNCAGDSSTPGVAKFCEFFLKTYPVFPRFD